MDTSMDTFSITDLRHKTLKILKQLNQKEIVYLFRRSKPEAALVSLNYLNALQEAYEDYLDILEYDRTIGLKRIPLGKHQQKTKLAK